MPAYQNGTDDQKAPYKFQLAEDATALQMQHYTGLEISHEPGQWGIWAGVLLMGFGLGVAFYMVHTRFWIMPVKTKDGNLCFGSAEPRTRTRIVSKRKYFELVAAIRHELGIQEKPSVEEEAEMAKA